MATAELYRLHQPDAQAILDESRAAIAPWRAEASKLGLSSFEVQLMENVIQA